jgi:hypothetical protein
MSYRGTSYIQTIAGYMNNNNKKHRRGLKEWLKWSSSCLASTRTRVQTVAGNGEGNKVTEAILQKAGRASRKLLADSVKKPR